MAADGAAEAAGPRYAPHDPTLPEPWKGLLDGSTGILYYWNPETNVTQYEKPTSLPPPLPSGPPPLPSTPNLAAVPSARTVQLNGIPSQQAHQIAQQTQMPHNSSQAVQQQLGPQAGPAMQQLGQQEAQHIRPQMMHRQSQQIFTSPDQQARPQVGNNQIPPIYQQGGGQVGQPQGYHYAHQQMQYMGYQQSMPQQGPPNLMQQQPQHPQPFSHQQENKAAFVQREDADFQQVKPVGFSPSPIPQSGVPAVQNPSTTASNPMQTQSTAQATQYADLSFNAQQPATYGQPQQSGMDFGHQQHAPRFQSQMGPSLTHGNVPPVGLKMGFEENPPGRSGNDHYFNAKNDGMTTAPHQPKLAAIPMARNQPEMRLGGLPLQSISPSIPGGPNPVSGPASHGLYGHASGGPPFPNNSSMRPTPVVMSSPDMVLSSVDVYRQKHDVTATGDNVPAPFMSFESTGFPPEILREVRYLLRRRSKCRTLRCYSHTYATSILS